MTLVNHLIAFITLAAPSHPQSRTTYIGSIAEKMAALHMAIRLYKEKAEDNVLRFAATSRTQSDRSNTRNSQSRISSGK